MNDIKFRYELYNYSFQDIESVSYPNRIGLNYSVELNANPEYIIVNRDLPRVDLTWEINNLKKTDRGNIWSLWENTLGRGRVLFTIIDYRKRLLFDCVWSNWVERWSKNRGGIYNISLNIKSPFPWTPPLFAFYPFINGLTDHCLDSNSDLSFGSGGSIVSENLVLTEQGTAAYAAGSDSISWFQGKNDSSVSLLAQFKTGEINNGVELDIINISDGNNKLRLYAIYSQESSSSLSSSSSSQGLSSSSSQGLSSSSSEGLSSSSSAGLSSSSSSEGLSSSSSQGLSSSSSQGLSSSSSQGISSSEGLSSSSSEPFSSSSSSQGLSSSSSSSQGLSSSSSNGISSSSSEGLSSSSSEGLSSSSEGLSSSSSSQGLSSSSSSQGLSSSSSSENYSLSISESSSSPSSKSTSSKSSSSSYSSSSSSGSSISNSSSGEGTTELTIGLEWTKSGESAESISMDSVNTYSNGSPAYYDVCGTFDNHNNKFYLYICRSGDTTKAWSYTFDYLYNTSSELGIPENSLISDLSPTNYPEDVTWSSVRLLSGDTADIYANDADKAQLNYVLIVDDYIPPTEFNWFRKLFHYWSKLTGVFPK